MVAIPENSSIVPSSHPDVDSNPTCGAHERIRIAVLGPWTIVDVKLEGGQGVQDASRVKGSCSKVAFVLECLVVRPEDECRWRNRIWNIEYRI